jgi:murein DD-endopeptidase MepM/ murein hydrolase activator NlpD
MNIIITGESGQGIKSFNLSSIFLFLILTIASLASLFFIYTYYLTNLSTFNSVDNNDNQAVIQLLKQQQQEITRLQVNIDHQMDNFVIKLAQMQSNLIQLDNLGEKLIKVGKLNSKEFNFNQESSIGGPEPSLPSGIEQRLSEILEELNNKSQQLYAIEALYDEQQYREGVTPKGKPAEKGWISSYFGKRKDPFTGKQGNHKGIDLAAKVNTKVIATADGIVSWAGKRSGYGNLVEINHGNGLVTRYGHCKTILVSTGRKVNQGEAIATIGSTGRSTGPHVHYEVIKNDIKINPVKYVRKKRSAFINKKLEKAET